MSAKDFIADFSIKTNAKPKEDEARRIISQFNSQYTDAYQIMSPFYAEAYTDLGFYLGNQWNESEKEYLAEQRRSAYTYNKVKRVVDVVDGYQRKNRLQSVVKPMEGSDEQTASQFTDVIGAIYNQDKVYEKISDANRGGLITGLGMLSLWLDYRDDPVYGDIRVSVDPWNSIIMDPFFTQRDLSDCAYIIRAKVMTRDTIKSLFPKKSREIDNIRSAVKDSKFEYLPWNRQATTDNKLFYSEYWRMDYMDKKIWVNQETGEWGEWKADDLRLEMFRRANPAVTIVTKPVKTVKMGVIVEDTLLSYDNDPNGLNEYPFVPFFATFEPSYDRFDYKLQSFVRVIRDPQRELNKRRSKTLDVLDSQLNSGWIVKDGAVKNLKSLYETQQGKVVVLNREAQLTDAQKLPAPDIPQSWFQLEAQFAKDIIEDAGVNNEMFGQSESGDIQTAAILAKQRQGAALVTLNGLFDNLSYAQTLLTTKTMKLIQANYGPAKIARILNKQPTPEFYTQTFGKYDCVVSEGTLTDTQKERTFLAYMGMKAAGIPIPDGFIVKNSNLHDSGELSKYMDEQQMAAAEAAQKQQQVEMFKLQQEANLAQSTAEANRGLAQERESRVLSNIGLMKEREMESVKDLEQANLNKIKAAKELQDIDLGQLERILNILNMLKAEEAQSVDATTTTGKPVRKARSPKAMADRPQHGEIQEGV
jgi:hypothetical protein